MAGQAGQVRQIQAMEDASDNHPFTNSQPGVARVPLAGPYVHIADRLEFQADNKQKNALKHFQKFLDIQFPGEGYQAKEIPPSIVTNDTFGCFMTYLSQDAHHYCDETKALLMLNSADGYASSVKQYIARTLFCNKPLPTVFNKTPWADLRKKLAKQVKEQVKREGGQLRGGHKTADKGDRKVSYFE